VPSGSSLASAGTSASARTDAAAAADHHVPLAIERAIAPRADLAVLTRYARVVRSVRPDLVHAHSSKAGAVARLGKLVHPRIPVLYTPHGYAFAGFFEHELERLAYREAERSLGLLARRVVAVCEAEARLAASVGPARRVRVVHNGIDPTEEGPPDQRIRALSSRGAIVCTVTQLRPGKGVETLIDALPAVVARHPDVQLAVVGDGPLLGPLQARARNQGVGATVHFLGEHADPGAVLRASDVFVLPSWAESFPYVILEAMLAGLPVLTSDVGGIAEAIVHGETGLLVSPRDHVAISRALLALLDDAGLRTRLGDAARNAVRQRFTRAGMIADLADVYEEVLSGIPRQ
jgi:glycosyltransferase involved in cell wall biosynthesis